jgi:hypothetical protein
MSLPTDHQLILDAIEQAQRILAGYVEPGPRNPDGAIEQLIEALARPEIVAACNGSGPGTDCGS